MELNGISAIVTGGASGLGAATARALGAEGVRVTVFDRNEEGAKAVAAEIGGNYVGGDVTVPDDCQRAVDQAAEGGAAARRRQLRRHRLGRPGHQPGRVPPRPRSRSSSSSGST